MTRQGNIPSDTLIMKTVIEHAETNSIIAVGSDLGMLVIFLAKHQLIE